MIPNQKLVLTWFPILHCTACGTASNHKYQCDFQNTKVKFSNFFKYFQIFFPKKCFFSFIIGLSIWLLVSAILQWPMCWYPNWHFKETSYCCRIEKTIELWSWRRALHWYIQTNCKCDKHSTSSIHLRTFQVKNWPFYRTKGFNREVETLNKDY